MSRVLLVDDSPGDLKLAQFAAKKSQRIEELKTFLEAREALSFLLTNDWRPHLIITDLEMPGMDGLELLRQLKSNVDLRCIPVVVFTTSASNQKIRTAYDLHANSVVGKPTEFPEYSEVWSKIEHYWFNVARQPEHG